MTIELPKVVLSMPIWRFAYAGAMRNLGRLMLQFPFYDYHDAENIAGPGPAREELTERFMATQGEFMFCADADMKHPDYAVARLLRYNLPLVAGLYCTRDGMPMAWDEDGDGTMRLPKFEPGTLIQRDLTGAGFLLVHRSVFEAFGPPWWLLDGKTGGCDFSFLRRAKQAGFKLHIDTALLAKQYDVVEVPCDPKP